MVPGPHRFAGSAGLPAGGQNYQHHRSDMHSTPTPDIIAYLKPHCGWSNGVRAILKKYDLGYEDRDIIGDSAQYAEMVRKSGQPLSPCVEVGGVMLADISGDELETWLLDQRVVQPNDREPECATDRCGCS